MEKGSKNLVASYYKEELVSTKNCEHLFKFKIELSKLNPNKRDLESFYFIDKNDVFWFEEILYNLFENCFEVNARHKFVDSNVNNRQIKMYTGALPHNDNDLTCKDFFDLVLVNTRRGIPRKNYKDYDGSLIRIREEQEKDESEKINEAVQLDFFNLLLGNK